MSTITEPGTRVRFFMGAAELLAKGNDLSGVRGLPGTVVPMREALRELNAVEATLRRTEEGRRAIARTPRDLLVAVRRDDGHGHQFATAGDLLPALT